MSEKWTVTGQQQIEHSGGYVTLVHAIRYTGGEFQVRQRLADSAAEYAEGKQRISLIVSAPDYGRGSAGVAGGM